jgi:uncharacterized membrane protein
LFRLWNLTASCLWFDEIFSVHAAKLPWNELFNFVAQDLIHPPFFYIALKIWIAAGGESLLWLRLFPVATACAALAPLILLCRELKFSTVETATMILLLAVNGSLIKYAQEVRMYSLLFCLGVFSMWLFARWARRESASFIPLLLINLLLIYTHYFGWLVVLIEVVLALRLNKERRKWLIYSGLWVLSFLPWAYAVFRAYKQNAGLEQNLNWADKPGLVQLEQFIAVLHQPFYFQQSSIDPAFSPWAIPVIIVCAGTVIYLFAVEKDKRSDLQILLCFSALPFLTALFGSWLFPYSIWGTRHLIVIFAPYFLLAAMGLKRIKLPALRYVCYGILILAMIPAFATHVLREQPVYSWCGWEPLAAQVKNSETTTVYAFEDAVAYEVWFALEREAKGRFRVVLIEDDPDIPEDKAYFLPRGFTGVQKANEDAIAGEKFWVAVRGIGDDAEHPLWRRLREKGYEMGAPLSFKAQDTTVYLVLVEKEK